MTEKNYAFFHMDKYKTPSQMNSEWKHCYRTIPVPNADKNLAYKNDVIIDMSGTSWSYVVKDKMKELGYSDKKNGEGLTFRKDGVRGLEAVVSYPKSIEDSIDLDGWKKDSILWLEKTFNACPEKYGDNLISAIYHADEPNCDPHMHVFIMPIDDKGHFNASYYTDGKALLSKYQDEYAKAMEKYGLSRGERGSRGTWQTSHKFNMAAKKAYEQQLPMVLPDETAVAYRRRVNPIYQDLYAAKTRNEFEAQRRIERAEARERNAISVARQETVLKEDIERDTILRDIIERFGSVEACKNAANSFNCLLEYMDEHKDDEKFKIVRQLILDADKYEKEKKQKEAESQEQERKDAEKRDEDTRIRTEKLFIINCGKTDKYN